MDHETLGMYGLKAALSNPLMTRQAGHQTANTPEIKRKMQEAFVRTGLLYGEEAMERLKNSRVAVFGVGGVGGYVAEALARSGVGAIDVIDNDLVSESNINRQIVALRSTIGRPKVEVIKERIADINPDCVVRARQVFYLPETEDLFDFTEYDYVADAIDTVSGKIAIIANAKKAGVPVISSMGAGNKTQAAGFMVEDIMKTSVCPLAKVMRRELKKRGIKNVKAVYSKEEPRTPVRLLYTDGTPADAPGKSCPKNGDPKRKKITPGSTACAPSVAGLIMAGEIINDLTKNA